jgi:hypothetical protein
MFRFMRAGIIAVTAAALAAACAPSTKFASSWKAPGSGPLNFKGKKVAALVINKEEGVRYGAEDALARAITAQGAVGVPAYSVIPKELTQDKEKAKEFLEKQNIAGVVAMRVVGKDQEITSSPSAYWGGTTYATFWGTGYYGSAWGGGGYYGPGWGGGFYEPGYVRTDTVVSVDTLVYSLEQDKLVWAGRSQTTNPDKVREFVTELTRHAAREMKKLGLINK